MTWFTSTEPARLVWSHTFPKVPLERAEELGRDLEWAVSAPGSIEMQLTRDEDIAELKRLRLLRKATCSAGRPLDDLADDIENLDRRMRGIGYFRDRCGPPEYLYIRMLCDTYRKFAGRNPGQQPDGPFVRFVQETTRQFCPGAKVPTNVTLRNAVVSLRHRAA